jgi:tetratricopeptide (TPR) repeat protein
MVPSASSQPRSARWAAVGALVLALALAVGYVFLNAARQPTHEAIRKALAEKRWEDVELGLRGWLREHPRDGDAWEMLGGLLVDQGRRPEALEALKRVREHDAGWAHAQTLVGEIYLEDHDVARAEQSFRRAAGRDGKVVEPLERLVSLLILERRTAEAHATLRRLFHATRDPRYLADGILISQYESDVRDLGPEIEGHLGKTPNDPWLRRVRGMYLLARGRAAEALPDLEFAATAFDDDPVGRFALAECRIALGYKLGDLSVLGSRPERPVDAARWWVLRGRLAEAWGLDGEAVASFQHAVSENPLNSEAHYRLGQALRREDPKDARAHLDRALELGIREDELRRELRHMTRNGFDRDGLVRAGRLCQQSGMEAEARDWFELAIEQDPRLRLPDMDLSRPSSAVDGAAVALSRPRLRANGERPATATEAVSPDGKRPRSLPRFEEIAASVGLRFQYEPGATPGLFIGDTMGGGVALIDYDRDGRLDVSFVNGCALPYDHASPPRPNKLFRNRPDGTFEDVTEKAGVPGWGYGMGCAVGDYDNDGYDDLFLTGLDRTVLYRNRGGGAFEDVTARAGVSSSRWTTAAGFGDLDKDGDLDLMVVTYVEVDPASPVECRDRSGRLIHCQPERFPAQFDHLFRNNGDGTFSDVSREAGIERPDGKGLGLAIADFDADGRLDLFVANDGTPNFLFRNLGGMKFEELGVASGAGYNGMGLATASMGVVAEDLNGDGLIDLFHTNFIDQTNTLRLNLGGGQFADRTLAANLGAPSRAYTGFGTVALDADNDGLLDLFVANGHTDDQPWFNTPMAEPAQLFIGRDRARFELAGPGVSPYFAHSVVGRGVAAGDLDNDGLVDLVVVHRDAPAALLRNRTRGGHWLGLRLQGTRSGRTPVGARVECRIGGRTQVRWLTSGTSYLSASDPRLWFGLGSSTTVDRLDVRWPSGTEQSWSGVRADRILSLVEGGELLPDQAASRAEP